MMKTSLDIVDIIYQALNGSSLKTAITGIICKRRPIDSTGEDVVITCLPVNNEQLQSAIVNVNIHVPNKQIVINGKQDNTQPDFARLKQLTTIAMPLLTDQWSGDYNFDVQQEVGPLEDENDHYINIRITFNSINLN